MITAARILAASGVFVLVLLFSAEAPALACGSTPGFCPNPPSCQETGNVLACS